MSMRFGTFNDERPSGKQEHYSRDGIPTAVTGSSSIESKNATDDLQLVGEKTESLQMVIDLGKP